ncbi:hypothetical protein BJY01DRAFT_27883 [Aspergillus pseudoustus]|uniref:Secreted protein n=1 Tax=Aspergillus pseudoustus TaxID=1810923 RepID=A0ABR4JKY0_9EURO
MTFWGWSIVLASCVLVVPLLDSVSILACLPFSSRGCAFGLHKFRDGLILLMFRRAAIEVSILQDFSCACWAGTCQRPRVQLIAHLR